MWVITYKGKPATVDTLNSAQPPGCFRSRYVYNMAYIAAPTKRDCVRDYLQHFGFTWGEREPGIDCRKVILKPD